MSERAVFNATCVAIDGRAVLIEGPPQSGKSSLALALIDRGASLIGDDGVLLQIRDETVWACPPPEIGGKLEIRGIGLVDLDPVSAPIALRLVLAEDAPRFVDMAPTTILADRAIPTLQLFPDAATLPLRTEWALRVHGLPVTNA